MVEMTNQKTKTKHYTCLVCIQPSRIDEFRIFQHTYIVTPNGRKLVTLELFDSFLGRLRKEQLI